MTDATANRLAEIAVELACRVRDYGPQENAAWLSRRLPDPGDWFRLAFVLAAAVPDDQPWLDLTAWASEPAPVTVKPRPPLTVVPAPKPALRPHGTLAAAARHRYRNEPLCQPCLDRVRTYDRDRARARRALTPDRRTA